MANLITNKHKKLEHAKKPTKFLKQISARSLRHATDCLDDTEKSPASRSKKNAARKRSGICPICLNRLAKNRKGTRYQEACELCEAQLNPDIRCSRCGTFRVWSNKSQARCKGCGNET